MSNPWVLVFAGSVVLVLIALLRARKSGHLFPQSLEEMIASGADKAVHRARSRYQVDLDYTIESIQRAEAVLGKIHAECAAEPQLVDATSMAFVFGAYIGETIRKNHPGAFWQRNHNAAGADSYPLHWGKAECFPMGWCFRRITQGEEDNVWVKYQLLKRPDGDAPETPKTRSATAGS